MAIVSLNSLVAGNVVANNVVSTSTVSSSLDRVHEELDKGNPMVFKLELNSSINAVTSKRAKGEVKLASTISALGGIGYLKTSSKKSDGNMFTDVSLLPKIKDDLTEEWVDKDNFLALVALRKEELVLTEEQTAENDFCLKFDKPLKHNTSCTTLSERLITKPFLKSVISKLLQSAALDDETQDSAFDWVNSGNQDAKLYFNDLEKFVSMQEMRESAGLLTIYFTLWSNEVGAILAPGKKAIPMPNGSLGLVWYLTPLAVTFEANKTTNLKRPIRVVDDVRSQAVKNVFDDLFGKPQPIRMVDVVSSSFFEEMSSYNLTNVKTGSKGHHEYRDELFDAASKGEWNAKAEKLLLDIGKSEKHTKFSLEQAQAMIAKAKAAMQDVLGAKPTIVSVVETTSESENDFDDDDNGIEPLAMEDMQAFFAGVTGKNATTSINSEEQLQVAELAALFNNLSAEGE